MKNENNQNFPNFTRLFSIADDLLGFVVSGLGYLTILFFGIMPIVAIVYLIGTKVFGLPG